MYKVKLTYNESTIELFDGNGDNVLPLNLDDFERMYKRSEQYFGVLLSFGNSLRFGLNAAKWIDKIYVTYGQGSIIGVEMYYSDDGTAIWKQFYKGKLDLTTRKKLYLPNNEFTIECNITNGDFESKLVDNLETVYDVSGIDLPGIENNYIEVLFRKRNSIIEADMSPNYGEETIPAILNQFHPDDPPVYFSHRLIKNIGDDRINDNYFAGFVDGSTSTMPMFTSEAECSVNVNGSMIFNTVADLGAIINAKIGISIYNADNELVNNYVLATQQVGIGNWSSQIYSPNIISFDFDFNMSKGWTLYIYTIFQALYNTYTVPMRIKENDSTNVNFYITEAQPDSTAYAIKQSTMFRRLVELATDTTGENRTITSILDNTEDVVTTGELLRCGLNNIVLDLIDPRVFTSLAEAFKSISAARCLGIGIDSSGFRKQVIIDHRSEFYKPEIIDNIGEVIELEEETASDLLYNEFKIMYPEPKNEIVNGRYEFNAGGIWTLPTNFVKNKLENVSSFRADGAGIEEARRTPFSISQSTDLKDDNAIFMVSCFDDNGTITTRRDEFLNSFENVPDNTYCYNVVYYPPYAMKYWAWWLLSGLQYYTETAARAFGTALNRHFKAYDNNAESVEVESVYDYETWDFTQFLKIAKLGNAFTNSHNALFDPVYYRFKAPVTWEFLNKFEANRHGTIQFTHNGAKFYGFAMEVPGVPGRKSEWKLLKLSKWATSLLT